MYGADFHSAIAHEEEPQAQRLAQYIATHLKPVRFIDFGCSTGLYVKAMKDWAPSCKSKGLDFSEAAIAAAVCPDIIKADLTQNLYMPYEEDTLGLCLEVLEHIDDAYWRIVLVNLLSNCHRVIFSAARPGQGGTGHINCRPKLDWIQRFHSLGWVVDMDATAHLVGEMKKGYHMGWLTQNVMVLVPGMLGMRR
jgi:hypothetical protein